MESLNFGKSNTAKNNKVAIYARISTLSQLNDGLGLEGQVNLCTKYCKLKKYDIHDTYADKAISGTMNCSDRSEFKRLYDDAVNGKFSILVCYKLDRMGRNNGDVISTIENLKKLNITQIFIEDGIDSSTIEGMLFLGIFASMNSYELEMIKRRLKAGLENKRKKNGHVGRKLPYGYVRINKQISLDPRKAMIIKYIFDTTDKGFSVNKIADALNEQNIETSRNKGKWHPSTVSRILDNKSKYEGLELINDNEGNVYWPKVL